MEKKNQATALLVALNEGFALVRKSDKLIYYLDKGVLMKAVGDIHKPSALPLHTFQKIVKLIPQSYEVFSV